MPRALQVISATIKITLPVNKLTLAALRPVLVGAAADKKALP